MSATKTFLNGGVTLRSLPVVATPPPPDAPSLKRLLLTQGELAQFYDGDEPIRYMAFIELVAGTSRGNHYHKVKFEYIYLLRGEVTLQVQEVNGSQSESVPLKAGDLVSIGTGIAHVLRVTESGQAIEFSPARFDAGDIYRFPL